MIDVAGRFTLDRQRQRQPGERVVVAGGDSPPRRRPRLEPSELHPEKRGVLARATRSGSSAKVAGWMSTNTGVAPAITMVEAEATNENAVVITSSPGPTPTAASASRSASVPDATPIA